MEATKRWRERAASIVSPDQAGRGGGIVRALLLLVLVVVAVGAVTAGTGRTPGASSATPRPLPEPELEPKASASAPAEILEGAGPDVPNPFVLVEESGYYVYSTETPDIPGNILMQTGPTMQELGDPVDVIPVLPPWVRPGYTWAPDVRRVGGRYVLWFTAGVRGGRPDAPDASQCIGVASADRPEGPFRSDATEPSVCQLDRWGSIDPRTFEDESGDLWLHWKSDDNAQAGSTAESQIFAQRLAPDGMTLVGTPTAIMEPDKRWEGHIVEAPDMVHVDGRYWLFYSGNWFNQPRYAIGVAECDGPAGPCEKHSTRPWLSSNAQGKGPGEASLFRDDEGWWIVYAPLAQNGPDFTDRPLALAPVAFGPDGPYLAKRP